MHAACDPAFLVVDKFKTAAFAICRVIHAAGYFTVVFDGGLRLMMGVYSQITHFALVSQAQIRILPFREHSDAILNLRTAAQNDHNRLAIIRMGVQLCYPDIPEENLERIGKLQVVHFNEIFDLAAGNDVFAVTRSRCFGLSSLESVARLKSGHDFAPCHGARLNRREQNNDRSYDRNHLFEHAIALLLSFVVGQL